MSAPHTQVEFNLRHRLCSVCDLKLDGKYHGKKRTRGLNKDL